MDEISAVVMYVGAGVEDVWYSGPGYYFGDPMSWMTGPFSTLKDAQEVFMAQAIEILDDGQE